MLQIHSLGLLRNGAQTSDRATAGPAKCVAKLLIEGGETDPLVFPWPFDLLDAPLSDGDDPADAVKRSLEQGISLILTNAPSALLLDIAAAGQRNGITLFNVVAPDDALRQEACRDNVIHVAPSRAMLADALGQYLVWKKWTRWVLAYGSYADDLLLADAYRRTAKRFGARIVKEVEFKDTGGARQTDSGVVQTQQQIPVFTQGMPDYDVLVTADETEVLAGYLPSRT